MEINAGTSESEGTKEEVRKVEVKTLRKVTVKIGLERIDMQKGIMVECHMQVYLSGKLHPHGDVTSKKYKPAFHGGHLSRNTSYGGATILWVFRLP